MDIQRMCVFDHLGFVGNEAANRLAKGAKQSKDGMKSLSFWGKMEPVAALLSYWCEK